MAYFNSSNVFALTTAQPVATPYDVYLPPLDLALAPEEPARFERTEWAVIALARHDDAGTLQEPRRSKLARLIFGAPRHYALAAERLEALRRLAIEAWHQPRARGIAPALSLPALGAFIAAGFTSAQLALLLSTTGAVPTPTRAAAVPAPLTQPVFAPAEALRNAA